MSTSSTTALSSVLSALNNGSSGIDVTSAVASIIQADRAPEVAWQAQQTALNNQATAIQQLESEAAAVTDSLQSLGDVTGAFNTVSATSSNTSVVSASAAPGTAAGNHTIEVDNLAVTGSWYSAEESSSSAALPSGSFDLTSGGNTKTFSTVGGVTLDQLAASINSAAVGVTASVVNDSNGARLALVAQNSGTAADFSITNDTALQLQQGTAGKDALIQVDGVPVTSASNTVTGAINGLTLSLQSAPQPPSPVTVSLAPDATSIQSSLSSFVSAYNTLITDLNQQFTFNGSTSSEGVLAADSSARSLQNDVLGAANLNVGSGSITNLASLGITTNQDGTLTLNTQTLGQSISTNYQGVVNFFQGTGGKPGFASTVTTTLNSYTDPSQGAFTVDLASNSNEFQDLGSQINTFELYIASQQTVLTAEYNNANIALQQLPEQIKQIQTLLGENTSGSNG